MTSSKERQVCSPKFPSIEGLTRISITRRLTRHRARFSSLPVGTWDMRSNSSSEASPEEWPSSLVLPLGSDFDFSPRGLLGDILLPLSGFFSRSSNTYTNTKILVSPCALRCCGSGYVRIRIRIQPHNFYRKWSSEPHISH